MFAHEPDKLGWGALVEDESEPRVMQQPELHGKPDLVCVAATRRYQHQVLRRQHVVAGEAFPIRRDTEQDLSFVRGEKIAPRHEDRP